MQNNSSDNQNQVQANTQQEKMQDIPKGFKKTIEKVSFMQGIMPMQNPIAEKLTSEHITAILSNSDKESERYYKQKNINKIVSCIFIAIVLVIVAVIMYIFRDNIKDIHDILLAIVTGVICGFGGYGYGIKKGSEQ